MRSPRLAMVLLAASLSLANRAAAEEPYTPPPPPPLPRETTTALTFSNFEYVQTIDFDSCDELKEVCAEATVQELINGSTLKPSHVGTCFLQLGGSPTDEAWAYVKQSWREGDQGYDGGTGAIGSPTSAFPWEEARRMAAEMLRQLCLTDACCCPNLPAHQPCSSQAPVVAWDPASGNCCEFANPCTMPSSWKLSPDLDDSDESNDDHDHRCPKKP